MDDVRNTVLLPLIRRLGTNVPTPAPKDITPILYSSRIGRRLVISAKSCDRRGKGGMAVGRIGCRHTSLGRPFLRPEQR